MVFPSTLDHTAFSIAFGNNNLNFFFLTVESSYHSDARRVFVSVSKADGHLVF